VHQARLGSGTTVPLDEGHASPDTSPLIEFRGLGKTFPRTGQPMVALHDITISIRTGEFVALLGPSGSGKSTLLEHVSGLQFPTSGKGTVLGVDPATASRARLLALRRVVGFVSQRFPLVGSRTVLENVCTGALGRLRGPRLGLITYPRQVREQALDCLERVGLGDRAFQRADTLSGGEQQRVAIARALLQKPRLLLADEPVASLDPESADQIMTLLKGLARAEHLTVLCSLHQVDLALSWAERIIGIRSGEVVLDEGTQGLVRNDVMSLYSHQAGALAELGRSADPPLTVGADVPGHRDLDVPS
jgi:phosphonate transport system ATP-binding protein